MPLFAHEQGVTKSIAITSFSIVNALGFCLTSPSSIRPSSRLGSLRLQYRRALRQSSVPDCRRSAHSLRPLRYGFEPRRPYTWRAGDSVRPQEENNDDSGASEVKDWHNSAAPYSGDALDEVTAPLESTLCIPPERDAGGLMASVGDSEAQQCELDLTDEGADDDLNFLACHEHWGSQATRSRNETYKRRLRQDNNHMLQLVDRKSSPRALRHLLQPSPSFHLEQALSEANEPKLLPRPRPRSVHDLSYRNAKTLQIFNVNGYRPPKSDDTVTLQSITAKYIRSLVRAHSQANDEDVLSDLPSELDAARKSDSLPLTFADLQMLRAAGYTKDDAQHWAETLLEPNIELATQRLVSPRNAASHQSKAKNGTPWFVANFLLRRENITAGALRLILDHAWRTLVSRQKRINSGQRESNNQPPSMRMVMTICVRLVRHARDVWPQAMPNITKLFATYLLDVRMEHYTKIAKPMKASILRQLTFKCNRMLSQLSLSGRKYPVLSAVHQQRAQFDLIRKMMAHQPPLPINREGHRALTKTLLLLRKTPQERDWALLQARSWPPFKISKTRLDDPKDRDYGTSTAGKAIYFMQGYGYPMLNWDYIAQVYSGWNPDGSPAIQQRALTPAVPTSFAGEPGTDELHAAIIACTRTVPEAWAAFLKFDSPDGKWRAIYMAMFKKLLIQEGSKNRRPTALVHPENEPAIGGDGIEILPPPSSPLEAIYLPSEPPSAEAFFDTLLDRNFPIFGELMYMLLEKAPSLEFGLKVWSAGKFLKIDVNGRMSWSTDHLLLLKSQTRDQVVVLPSLPNELLAAFTGFVMLHPSSSTAELALIDRTELKAGGWWLRSDHGLVYAYRLLTYYNLPQAFVWNGLLKALTVRTSLRHAISSSNRSRERFWPLIAWAMSGNVMRSMVAAGATPDHLSFQYMCDITYEAAVVVRLHGMDREDVTLEGVDGQEDLEREFVEAQLLMSQGSSLLRRRFLRLVGLDKDLSTLGCDASLGRSTIPSHLSIPKAVVLHKYIRALGMLGDHEGIYSLVRWMVDAANDLHELQETQLNGRQHMRRLIVALRVWLECPSRDFVLAERHVMVQPASEELVQLVRSEVEHVKQWGGWPSDDQVDKYCRR